MRPRTLRFLSIALGVVMTASVANAQEEQPDPNVAVEGQVFDHLGGGVAGVEVSVRAPNAADGDPPLAQVATNDFGDFRITRTPPLAGQHVVVFEKAGYTSARREVTLTPGEWPPFIDLALTGALGVQGTVVDRLTEKPVPDAPVRLVVAGSEWNIKTDEGGHFAFDKVIPGKAEITVTAEGFAHAEARTTVSADSEPVRILLSPERIVEFEVVGPGGQSVAGATVECLEKKSDDYRALITDEAGMAVLRGARLESTEMFVRLSHQEYVADAGFERRIELPANEKRSRHRLVLEGAGWIAGKVTDAATGRTMHGVRVTVGDDGENGVARDWTGLDGTYRVVGARPGDTVVTTYLNGYSPELKEVTVPSGDGITVEFVLAESQAVGGMVVNQKGEAISGAYVFATKWRGRATLGISTLTAGDGRFVFATVPADEFEVAIQAAGYDALTGQRVTPGKTDHRFELIPRTVAPASKLQVGQPFPNLELVSLDGQSLKMSDLKGRTVLIDFWATWCGPCLAEIPHLAEVHKEFGSRKDFLLIGISIDLDEDEKNVRRFVKDKSLAWTQVFGSTGKADQAASACGVEYIPQTFLVGPDGVLRAIGLSGPTIKQQVQQALTSGTSGQGNGG